MSDLLVGENLSPFEERLGLWVAGLILALVLLVPRVLGLASFVNIDACLYWMSRSTSFYGALARLDLGATLISAHPGVTVMWLSGAGLVIGSLLETGTVDVWAHLHDLLWYAKIPLAILTSVGVLASGVVLKRYIGQTSFALLAVLLLALDPVFLAHSRYLHLDATNAILTLLCLLLTSAYIYRGKSLLLVASAVAGGLALLTRSTAAGLLVFAPLMLLAPNFIAEPARSPRTRFADVGKWLLLCSLTFVILWPAMWVTPVEAISQYISGAVGGIFEEHAPAVTNHASKSSSRAAPDATLDFLHNILSVRSTAVWVLFVAAVADIAVSLYRRTLNALQMTLVWCIGFAILFLAGLSLSAKAVTLPLGYRYALPVLIVVQLTGAYGLYAVVRRTFSLFGGRRPRLRFLVLLLLAVVLLWEGRRVFGLHPYYSTYHNEFVRPTAFGWGEGLERVASHLNQKDDAQDLVVASPFACVLDMWFEGSVVLLSDEDKVEAADYVVLYVNHAFRPPYTDVTRRYLLDGEHEPELVVTINNIDYAWVFRR